jgi:recombination protein RecT
VGKLFIAKQMSMEPIRDIRLYMVHENDCFVFEQINGLEPRETFSFNIKDPFNRGAIKGGFGFIRYEDESLNKVVLVSEEEFKKAENVAKSTNFWRDWGDRMRFKTLAHRVSDAVHIDPRKVLDSFYEVQKEDDLFSNPINHEPKEQSIDLDIPEVNAIEGEEVILPLNEPSKGSSVDMSNLESMAVGTAFE